MNKLNSFATQFVAAIKGDDAEVKAMKAWRSAESALKVQIANLDGDVIRKEDAVTQAQENLDAARINSGHPITDRDTYVANLLSRKERLTQAERELEAHVKTTEFLKEEYANLSKEAKKA